MTNLAPFSRSREEQIREHMLRLARLTRTGVKSSELEVVSTTAHQRQQQGMQDSRHRSEKKIALIDRWRGAVVELRWLQGLGPVRLSTQVLKNIITQATSTEVPAGEGQLIATDEVPAIRSICNAVAQHYGIDLIEFASRRSIRRLMLPRQVAIYLASKLTWHNNMTIGHVMHRDHSSVDYAIKEMKRRLRQDPKLATDIAAIMTLLDRERQARETPQETA